MKYAGLVLACCVAFGALCSLTRVPPADAYPTFSKAFMQKYIADESTDTQKSLAEEFKRVKRCAVCHDPRKGDDGKVSRKNRNPYGDAVNKFLTKKDQKDLDKALKMLDKVAGEKLEDAEKTFGELIEAGKLPFEYPDFNFGGEEEDEDDD
jgi:hypothetical protein